MKSDPTILPFKRKQPLPYLYLVLFLTIVTQNITFAQIPISPRLIGENAWGRENVLLVKDQLAKVKYQTIRIGGNNYERGAFIDQYAIKLIDFVRSIGAEPIVQIPRQLKDNNAAYEAIAYINGKMGRNVKYWSIGNEPDHKNQLASPEEVFDYFKKISAQIKSYDPQAKVMGFDLSSYKPLYLDRFLGGDLDLTGKIPGKPNYYLDIVTFHGYRFADIGKFEGEVKALKTQLNTLNAKRANGEKLGWAITEFNSHWKIDHTLYDDYMPFNFHNGQIFAEVYDLGMREGAFTICPWSILEGGAKREGTDLSIFDKVDSTYLPRSNYYHTQLLAQNIKKYYLEHTPNSKDLAVIPMGDSSGLAIMVINKNKSAGQNYILNLKKGTSSDAHTVFINARINKAIKDSIPAESTKMFILNNKGEVNKIYTYSARDEAIKEGPHLSKGL